VQGEEAWAELMSKHMPTRLNPTAHMDFLRTHMAELAPLMGEHQLVDHTLEHALLYTGAASPVATRSRALMLLSLLCTKLPAAVDVHPSAGRQAL
jgi:hypothetical protein